MQHATTQHQCVLTTPLTKRLAGHWQALKALRIIAGAVTLAITSPSLLMVLLVARVSQVNCKFCKLGLSAASQYLHIQHTDSLHRLHVVVTNLTIMLILSAERGHSTMCVWLLCRIIANMQHKLAFLRNPRFPSPDKLGVHSSTAHSPKSPRKTSPMKVSRHQG